MAKRKRKTLNTPEVMKQIAAAAREGRKRLDKEPGSKRRSDRGKK